MNQAQVVCPKCRTALPDASLNQPEFGPCGECQAPVQVFTFPALHRVMAPGVTGERLVIDTDASCFYHGQKKAVLPCDGCGRFLCALCDVEMDGRHLCPNCLHAGRQKGTLQTLETRRTAYDTSTLLLGVVPLVLIFLWPFYLVSGPAAVILGIYGWKKPGSLLRRSRWRFVAGIVGGVIQVLAVAGIGVAMFFASREGAFR